VNDEESRDTRSTARVVLNWFLIYGSWVALSAAAVATVFALRQDVILAYTTFGWDKHTMAMVDKWLLLVLGIAALIWILYLQHHLVQGYPGGRSLGSYPRRLRGACLVTFAVLVPALLIQFLL